MTTEPQIAVEPVTDEDYAAACATAFLLGLRPVLEQDRRRVVERQAARPLEKIDRDESYGRSYIPVAPGWEVQTKGKGSTFRLCEPSGDRLAVPDSPYLHATIERMALAIHAHRVTMEKEVERLRAEVARLSAACAAKDEALRLLTDMDELRETDELYIARAALSDTAGKGWIDASGAVEATCFSHCEIIGREPFGTYRDVGRVEVPKDWADDEVLIVRKPK